MSDTCRYDIAQNSRYRPILADIVNTPCNIAHICYTAYLHYSTLHIYTTVHCIYTLHYTAYLHAAGSISLVRGFLRVSWVPLPAVVADLTILTKVLQADLTIPLEMINKLAEEVGKHLWHIWHGTSPITLYCTLMYCIVLQRTELQRQLYNTALHCKYSYTALYAMH